MSYALWFNVIQTRFTWKHIEANSSTVNLKTHHGAVKHIYLKAHYSTFKYSAPESIFKQGSPESTIKYSAPESTFKRGSPESTWTRNQSQCTQGTIKHCTCPSPSASPPKMEPESSRNDEQGGPPPAPREWQMAQWLPQHRGLNEPKNWSHYWLRIFGQSARMHISFTSGHARPARHAIAERLARYWLMATSAARRQNYQFPLAVAVSTDLLTPPPCQCHGKKVLRSFTLLLPCCHYVADNTQLLNRPSWMQVGNPISIIKRFLTLISGLCRLSDLNSNIN